jgi:hypothetical protein
MGRHFLWIFYFTSILVLAFWASDQLLIPASPIVERGLASPLRHIVVS